MRQDRAAHRLRPERRAPRPAATDPPELSLVARLQRSAGNAAVARLLAPRRMVARFEAGEHAQMGSDEEITVTAGDGGVVELTQSDLVALGDFYDTPEEMLSAPAFELTELRDLIRRDRMAFEGVPGAEPVTTDEWKEATRHREEGKTYLDLLEDNAGHFAPPSDGSAGSGEDHRTLFFSNHFKALAMAHAAASTTGTVPDEAFAVTSRSTTPVATRGCSPATTHSTRAPRRCGSARRPWPGPTGTSSRPRGPRTCSAAKSIQNLDVAIDELVDAGYLVPRPEAEEPEAPQPPQSYVPSGPREDYAQSHRRR